MKKTFISFTLLIFLGCQNLGNLKLLTDLPQELKEVSGTEIVVNSNLIWMLNDSGNKPKLFGINEKGKVIKEVKVKAKNKDWEDLTSDEKGNLYIGDFGNNLNKRKNLVILKIHRKFLNKEKAEVERIQFRYPNQKKFPPKKKKLFFDTESFFYFKDSLYILTKSRVKGKFGKTTLYKIPAKKGSYIAEIVDEYENCKELECWITSADISPNKKKVVLLSQKNILLFSNFKGDKFLSGDVKKIDFVNHSQKEGITFKNDSLLLITDEKAHGAGGNLYSLDLKSNKFEN